MVLNRLVLDMSDGHTLQPLVLGFGLMGFNMFQPSSQALY